MFLDIEDRWNKGKFGREYEDCEDSQVRKKWNKKTNLGHEKVLEVRKCHNDFTAIQEFFTPELCEKLEFCEYKRKPDGDYILESRNYKNIRKRLLERYANGGLPDVRLVDPNHRGKGHLLIQHMWDGRQLKDPYTREVMTSIYRIWQNRVVIATRDRHDQECVYICDDGDVKNVKMIDRAQYENEW